MNTVQANQQHTQPITHTVSNTWSYGGNDTNTNQTQSTVISVAWPVTLLCVTCCTYLQDLYILQHKNISEQVRAMHIAQAPPGWCAKHSWCDFACRWRWDIHMANKCTNPTDVPTQGGPGYAPNPTKKPMTVIYTMNTKKLPSGYLWPMCCVTCNSQQHIPICLIQLLIQQRQVQLQMVVYLKD